LAANTGEGLYKKPPPVGTHVFVGGAANVKDGVPLTVTTVVDTTGLFVQL
jgi:hypothetical protein